MRAFALPRYLLPTPLDVAKVFHTDAALITRQFLVTVQEWAWGLLVSVILAFCMCAVCVGSEGARRIVVRPVLVASQAIPYLSFAPLLLLWPRSWHGAQGRPGGAHLRVPHRAGVA